MLNDEADNDDIEDDSPGVSVDTYLIALSRVVRAAPCLYLVIRSSGCHEIERNPVTMETIENPACEYLSLL